MLLHPFSYVDFRIHVLKCSYKRLVLLLHKRTDLLLLLLNRTTDQNQHMGLLGKVMFIQDIAVRISDHLTTKLPWKWFD